VLWLIPGKYAAVAWECDDAGQNAAAAAAPDITGHEPHPLACLLEGQAQRGQVQ
jgi:hypothetical protein